MTAMSGKGKIFVLSRGVSSTTSAGTPQAEEGRWRTAYDKVKAVLADEAGTNEIFAAHLEILEDPMLAESVMEGISGGLSAERALADARDAICAMFSQIEDEYLRARADDVKDVCGRVERALNGDSENPFKGLEEGTVIVAEELFPSDTSLMDFSKIAGFITAKGSITSHVCIIARSKGIPALVGRDISSYHTGDEVDLDFLRRSAASFRGLPAFSGKIHDRVKLYCNAGSVEEVRAAIEAGAEGIGLFRTEFLFMQNKDRLPSEDEQFEVYRAAALSCGGRPLTIRTLDIGGDKALPCLPVDKEDNPMLGLRGLRFCLAHPEIFRTQTAALCRAAEYGNIRVMFPMVDTLEELRQAKAMFPPEISCGIMVETPSAVLCAEQLAPECDFFSIGTNDLTQYIMAADRGNSSVGYLYEPFSQAMRRALSLTVEAARESGTEVCVCGEVASFPDAAAFLAGIGVNSLSVSIPCLKDVRNIFE